MMHEKDEVFNLIRLMCNKTIALQDNKNTNECIKNHDIDDLASIARLVTAEIGDQSTTGNNAD